MKESHKLAILIGAIIVFVGTIVYTGSQQNQPAPVDPGSAAQAPPDRPPPVSVHSPRAPSPTPAPSPDFPGGLFKGPARQLMVSYCQQKDASLGVEMCQCGVDWMFDNTNPALISFGVAQISKGVGTGVFTPGEQVEQELMVAAGIANRRTATARFAEEEFKALAACRAQGVPEGGQGSGPRVPPPAPVAPE